MRDGVDAEGGNHRDDRTPLLTITRLTHSLSTPCQTTSSAPSQTQSTTSAYARGLRRLVRVTRSSLRLRIG